jgi:CubicO group peptidase (beta-lactamase class C family)
VAGALVDFLGNPDYPDDFWQTATLEASHVDEAPLQQALAKVNSTQLEIHGFVLARNGRLVLERYGWKTGRNADDPDKSQHQVTPTERHLLHSTTKSVTSTLIGIALDEGLLPSVNDLVVPHFPEYQPLPEPSADKDAMTVEDLLTMRSGLQWEEATADYDAVLPSADPAKTMLSRPLVDKPVGTVWNYSTGACDILTALLGKVTQKTPLEYARDKLFSPLGITNVTWEASANGINHGGYGLSLTPREMARFGELMRNRGQWGGRQVVSSSYVETATSVHCATYWSGSYGYLFWIPGLPGFFGTRGAYGQNIYVNRDLGVVVAVTSDLPVEEADSRLDGLMGDYIIPALK